MAFGLPHSGSVATRMARAADVARIVSLIQPYARAGFVLARPATDIRAHLANFMVAEGGDELVGCVALRDFGDGLEEVRTLAVAEGKQGRGLGSMLVRAAIHLARERGTSRLFALTVRPNLFDHLGFAVVPKSRFPRKVWADCRLCPKRDRCDETAVVLSLENPAAQRAEAQPPPSTST